MSNNPHPAPETAERKRYGRVAYEAYAGRHADWGLLFESDKEDWDDAAAAVIDALPCPIAGAAEGAEVAGPGWELVNACEKSLREALPCIPKDYSQERAARVAVQHAIALISEVRAGGQ